MQLRRFSWHRIISVSVIGEALLFTAFSIWFLLSKEEDRLFLFGAGIVSSVGALIPLLAYQYTQLSRVITYHGRVVLEALTGLLLAQNALGALGLYELFKYYDALLHLTGPMGVGLVVSIVITAILRYRKKYSLMRVQFWSLLWTACLVVFWEVWEFAGDRWFGTTMLGQLGERYDTVYDIAIGLLALPLVYYIIERYIEHPRIWKQS